MVPCVGDHFVYVYGMGMGQRITVLRPLMM